MTSATRERGVVDPDGWQGRIAAAIDRPGATWPNLTEVLWWDGALQTYESAARTGGVVRGDDLPLPRHGGVWLMFSATTTVTLVGSEDLAYSGPTDADLRGWPRHLSVLPVAYNTKWTTGSEILCGERGIDWLDLDADTLPDWCGRDTNGDFYPDTGLFGGGWRLLDDNVYLWGDLASMDGAGGPLFLIPATEIETGPGHGIEISLIPGRGYPLDFDTEFRINAPFRPSRW